MKYYVVGPPRQGQREFLFEIAAKTLGDGLRYREIYELNLGRAQPDGRRLVNPAVIEPGWILLLPTDASGPDVRIGPMPQHPVPRGTDSTNDRGSGISHGQPRERPPLTLRLGAILALAGAVLAFALRHGELRTPRRPRFAAASAAKASVSPTDEPAPGAESAAMAATGQGPLAFTAKVALGHDLVGVRLVGSSATDAGVAPPYGWEERASQVPEHAKAPVCIGKDDAGYLFVDLAQTPDVVTVTGRPDARARLAVSVANQLLARRAHHLGVTVVGEVVDRGRLRRGSRFVPEIAELVADGPTRAARWHLVICAVTRDADLDLLRHLVRSSRRRVVPVVVGDVPPSRWSFDVQ